MSFPGFFSISRNRKVGWRWQFSSTLSFHTKICCSHLLVSRTFCFAWQLLFLNWLNSSLEGIATAADTPPSHTSQFYPALDSGLCFLIRCGLVAILCLFVRFLHSTCCVELTDIREQNAEICPSSFCLPPGYRAHWIFLLPIFFHFLMLFLF